MQKKNFSVVELVKGCSVCTCTMLYIFDSSPDRAQAVTVVHKGFPTEFIKICILYSISSTIYESAWIKEGKTDFFYILGVFLLFLLLVFQTLCMQVMDFSITFRLGMTCLKNNLNTFNFYILIKTDQSVNQNCSAELFINYIMRDQVV